MFERRRVTVQGVIQGIGFRPFIFRLAREQALTGRVFNDGSGVSIELQGEVADLDEFERRLARDIIPDARIDRSHTEKLPAVDGEREFLISVSADTGRRSISLAPDRYVCSDCLRELDDPTDRRHYYPFINCTHCGPRYTIATELPYDRDNTTMEPFRMCPDCRREYQNPVDRRYHAQPIACPVCGPRTWLAEVGHDSGLPPDPSPDWDGKARAVFEAAALLRRGGVVAVKGIGGIHLAVDAKNKEAVERLRAQKNRMRKPLAVMVRDLGVARDIVSLDREAEQRLLSPAAPIVIAPRRAAGELAETLAPGLADIGVMLPYSPLHHLLFGKGLEIIVMTSGNNSSEPIIKDNWDALAHLSADAFLLHDRDIHVACDDSVIRSSSEGPVFVRRSRGYVPEPLDATHLPRRAVLALGAELKVTVTTLNSGEMVVGRHLGDLDNVRAENAFSNEVKRMLRFGQVQPEAVAVDLHPDFYTTQHAEQTFADRTLIRVQHHHAHLAAVLVEHGCDLETTAVGIILDGLGYGTDGLIWGGEVLEGGYLGYKRMGHLRSVPLPGGDRAAIEPHRMATSLLVDAGLGQEGMQGYDGEIARICPIPSVSPLTSSAGRLFDGVASLLGVAPKEQDYEGEAATRLEAVADPECKDAYPLPIIGTELDVRPLIGALVEDREEASVRAARFHNSLADGLATMALSTDKELVVLSGGCMVNRLLLRRLLERLRAGGVKVLWPRLLPPGDGGISAGQAACAACILEKGD